MPITESIRSRITGLYCFIFFLILLNTFVSKGFLFQLVPSIFYNKLDFTTWLVLLTNGHKLLLNNRAACAAFDGLYAVMPFVYYWTYKKGYKAAPFVAWMLVLVNFVYAVLYCSFPTDSLEGHIALILFPVVFLASSLTSFWFLFQALRYFFLFFFVSAGIWKFVQGGIFNGSQMSAILIYQHKEILVSGQPSLLAGFYHWLIRHQQVSYSLYAGAALMELSFVTGFFRRDKDRLLAVLFLIFLVMDMVVMRIDYWSTAPFLLTLVYSGYKEPAAAATNR